MREIPFSKEEAEEFRDLTRQSDDAAKDLAVADMQVAEAEARRHAARVRYNERRQEIVKEAHRRLTKRAIDPNLGWSIDTLKGVFRNPSALPTSEKKK